MASFVDDLKKMQAKINFALDHLRKENRYLTGDPQRGYPEANQRFVSFDKAEVEHFDAMICDAISNAKRDQVPQGLIVAILQARSIEQTQELLE